jgi:hypothetical protein
VGIRGALAWYASGILLAVASCTFAAGEFLNAPEWTPRITPEIQAVFPTLDEMYTWTGAHLDVVYDSFPLDLDPEGQTPANRLYLSRNMGAAWQREWRDSNLTVKLSIYEAGNNTVANRGSECIRSLPLGLSERLSTAGHFYVRNEIRATGCSTSTWGGRYWINLDFDLSSPLAQQIASNLIQYCQDVIRPKLPPPAASVDAGAHRSSLLPNLALIVLLVMALSVGPDGIRDAWISARIARLPLGPERNVELARLPKRWRLRAVRAWRIGILLAAMVPHLIFWPAAPWIDWVFIGAIVVGLGAEFVVSQYHAGATDVIRTRISNEWRLATLLPVISGFALLLGAGMAWNTWPDVGAIMGYQVFGRNQGSLNLSLEVCIPLLVSGLTWKWATVLRQVRARTLAETGGWSWGDGFAAVADRMHLGKLAADLRFFGGSRGGQTLVRDQKAQALVLLLRPFSEDARRIWAIRTGRWGLIRMLGFRPRVTLEQVVTSSVRDRGALRAIGNPRDLLPPTAGAVRMRFADSAWRTAVLEFAERAQLIVVVLGRSGGLVEELQMLSEPRLLEKALLIVPPDRSADVRAMLELATEHLGVVLPPLDGAGDAIAAFHFLGGEARIITSAFRDDLAYSDAIRVALSDISAHKRTASVGSSVPMGDTDLSPAPGGTHG